MGSECQAGGLTQRLKQASREILIEARPIEPAEHRSNVPVALRNPGILSPFELLVNTYARPRYEEIDPTALIAITFPLLYGAMFGDVGHGLVLAAIGWFLSQQVDSWSRLLGFAVWFEWHHLWIHLWQCFRV